MSGEVKEAKASEDTPVVDAFSIEVATGLSIKDIEMLGADPSPDVMAEIAVKFADAFDRHARTSINRVTHDLLKMFSKDRANIVRMKFAHAIRKSLYLPVNIAETLASDELDIAAPMLRDSPVLDDAFIGDIVINKPEAYASVIADRRPLREPLVDLLIEHRGTKGVIARLLDNIEAELSETALKTFREWGRSDPDLADKLRRRPNLPFAFVSESVVELADQVQWPTLGERTMTRFEATQLQGQVQGRAGGRCSPKGERFRRLHRALKDEFEKGRLTPQILLGFLRNRDVDRLECGFSVMTGVDLLRVRSLLYGSDRRGLVALCLKAEFGTVDYLAFRMALSLAEQGMKEEKPKQRYLEKNLRFAHEQFERMRTDTELLDRWIPPSAA